MKPAKLAIIAALLAAGGCLSKSAKIPTVLWTITPPETDAAAGETGRSGFQPLETGCARIGSVVVSAPFDAMPVTVKRHNGSVARDPMNQFAAAPAALVRPVLAAALVQDGRFGKVLAPASNAAADVSIDCQVAEISLDCSATGTRYAVVKLELFATDAARASRRLIASGRGESRVNAISGNYTSAFSAATANAIRQALSRMTVQ